MYDRGKKWATVLNAWIVAEVNITLLKALNNKFGWPKKIHVSSGLSYLWNEYTDDGAILLLYNKIVVEHYSWSQYQTSWRKEQ